MAISMREINDRRHKQNRIVKMLPTGEERFRILFEQAADAIVVFDTRTGEMAEFNDKAHLMFGYTRKEFLKLKLADIEALESETDVAAHIKKVIKKGSDVFETKQRKKDGTICDVLVNVKLVTLSGKKYIQGIWRDITQFNKAKDDLRNERNRAQMYLDVAAVIFMVLDVTGKVMLINMKGCEILGRDESGIIGKNWFECFIPDNCRDNVKAAFIKLMEGKVRPVEYFENPVLRYDGQERIIAWHNTILQDEAGNVTGTLSSGEDITERKLAEEKLQYNQKRLKTLAAKLSLAEEQERHRIAMGIHDDLGQKLAVVKLHLQTLRESVTQKRALAEIDIACNLTDEMIDDIRSLTFELSNPVLYEIGLEQALRAWLTNEIQDKTGLNCIVVSDCGKLGLDDDINIVLFKAVRELMTNIVKHAQAKTAKIILAKPDTHVVVTVEDDGVGFDVSKLGLPSSKEGGFGLFNIRERLDFMGGRLDIDSRPGKGTRVIMTVPSKNSAPVRQNKNPN